ncbi:Transferase [Mactra antiquata]
MPNLEENCVGDYNRPNLTMRCYSICRRTPRKYAVLFALVCLILVLWFNFLQNGWTVDIEKQETATLAPGVDNYIRSLSESFSSETEFVSSKKSPRILCLILTVEENIETRARVVNNTWLKRCNLHYFVLRTENRSLDVINTPFGETRQNIVRKVWFAFRYIYDYHLNDFDWLLKADDDTYVIVENLRKLLETEKSTKPSYLGFHFNKFIRSGYMSGGAGYVISRRALTQFFEIGIKNGLCPILQNEDDPENSEDIETGQCLNISGVSVINSLDDEGRERFHPYPVDRHAFGWLPEYVFEWSKHKQRQGPECCSRYSVSFHYMEPHAMLLIDHLLYRTSVYGFTGH